MTLKEFFTLSKVGDYFNMKIGVISIHYGFNFGSALQAYALVQFINNDIPNADAKLLNYIPQRYSIKRRYFTTNKYNNVLKKYCYLILVAPQRLKNQRIFNLFLKSNIPMTRKFTKIEDAVPLCNDFDFLICGSDQVWNSDYNEFVDPMYYLTFASDKTVKLSYAASCGKEDYTDEEWNLIYKFLSDFRGVSLREKSSTELFIKHGFLNAIQCLDPIFLLNKDDWRKLQKKPSRHIQDYVLIYYLDSDESDIIRIAKEVAQAKGLKTAIITYSHIWNRYDVDYVFRNESPNIFLWLLFNAKFVVTNSFHGVAFSINLEKQFLAIKRRKYNNRLDSILHIMNLKNRYISCDSSYDNRDDIDYNSINKIKNNLVKESKDYLLGILKEN